MVYKRMKRALNVAIKSVRRLAPSGGPARCERKVSGSEQFRQAATNFLGPAGDRDVDRYARGGSRGVRSVAVSRGPGSVREARGAQREGGRMGSYVLGFEEIDQTQVAVVGGK